MPKGDITWTRRTDEGERVEVNVRHVGDRWIFHSRERRPEHWRLVDDPPLEDWLRLLDAVNRRVGRGLIRDQEVERLKKIILDRYPAASM
jgi:hypothetical protein